MALSLKFVFFNERERERNKRGGKVAGCRKVGVKATDVENITSIYVSCSR